MYRGIYVAGGFAPIDGLAYGHTRGLTTDGDAYCWGNNERGQLGTGGEDLDPHPVPEPVTGGHTFTALTVGLGRHVCGLTDAGAAYCWGENSFGALGDGSTTDHAIPVPVTGGHAFAQVVAGGFIGHTCGLTVEGTAYCWGDNEVGQIGDGTTTDRSAPWPVSGGLVFTSIDAGFRHTCARANSETLYCWGSNGAGQVGINSNSSARVPVPVFGQP